MKYKVGDYYVFKYTCVVILFRVEVVSGEKMRSIVVQSNWYGRKVGDLVSHSMNDNCLYPYTFDVGV